MKHENENPRRFLNHCYCILPSDENADCANVVFHLEKQHSPYEDEIVVVFMFSVLRRELNKVITLIINILPYFLIENAYISCDDDDDVITYQKILNKMTRGPSGLL